MKNFFSAILLLVIVCTSCSKSQDHFEPASLTATLTRNTWNVEMEQAGQSYIYANAILAFDQRGFAALKSQEEQAMGNWSILKENVSLQLQASSAHIQNLNRTWQLESQSATSLRLRSQDPAGEILILTRK